MIFIKTKKYNMMILLKKFSLFLSFLICMYSTNILSNIQEFEALDELLLCKLKTVQNDFDQRNLDIFITLKILKTACRDIKEEDFYSSDHFFMNEIIEILVDNIRNCCSYHYLLFNGQSFVASN